MRIIGNGGHAAVVRELHEVINLQFDDAWTIIAIGDNASRKREAESLMEARFATLIHPGAIVSPSATIGNGTVIMAGAIVQAQARIGRHVIVNTGATVDHHAIIGDFAHIAPGAHLCGGVEIGEGALVGCGIGLEPGCRVSPWYVVKREGYSVCPMK